MFLVMALLAAQAAGNEGIATPARPRTPPESWITADDYPQAALRDGKHGRVAYQLVVAPDGKVASCAITTSSGSDLLDRQTCILMARRGRFSPALDARGGAVLGSYAGGFTWNLAKAEPRTADTTPPRDNYAREEIELNAAGDFVGCTFHLANPPVDMPTCRSSAAAIPTEIRTLLGDAHGRILLVRESVTLVNGAMPELRYGKGKYVPRTLIRERITYGSSGAIIRCSAEAQTGGAAAPFVQGPCEQRLPPAPIGPDGKATGGTVTVILAVSTVDM